MPNIKIHLPVQLPDMDDTETKLDIWLDWLKTYLDQDTSMQVYMDGRDSSPGGSQEKLIQTRLLSFMTLT